MKSRDFRRREKKLKLILAIQVVILLLIIISSFVVQRTAPQIAVNLKLIGSSSTSRAPTASGIVQSTATSSLNMQVQPEVKRFFDLVNQYRQQNGLQPLKASVKLTNMANWMASDMANDNYWPDPTFCGQYGLGAHCDNTPRDIWQRFNDFGYTYNTWKGENLGRGTSDAQIMIDNLKGSPGHNANLLNPNFVAVGVSMVYNPNSASGWYWTQDFGGYLEEEAIYTSCSNTCSLGAKQCSGNSVQECRDTNADSCTDSWVTIQTCSSNQICSGSSCIAVCSGDIRASLNPSTLTPSGSTTPSASGLSDCSGKTIRFKRDSCSESTVKSCTSSSSGCTASAFTAPSTSGIYNYYSCIDKNGDGDTSDAGESDMETLTVQGTITVSYFCSGSNIKAELTWVPKPGAPGHDISYKKSTNTVYSWSGYEFMPTVKHTLPSSGTLEKNTNYDFKISVDGIAWTTKTANSGDPCPSTITNPSLRRIPASSTHYESGVCKTPAGNWCAIIDYSTSQQEYEGEMTFDLAEITSMASAKICAYRYYKGGIVTNYIEKISSSSCSAALSRTSLPATIGSASIPNEAGWHCIGIDKTQVTLGSKLYVRWWGQDLNGATSPYACYKGPATDLQYCGGANPSGAQDCRPYLEIQTS